MTTLLFSCTDENPLNSTYEDVVVSAFVYANEPVHNILLNSTVPLGTEDEEALTISNANVYLTVNNIEFKLSADSENPGYYGYDESDLKISYYDRLELRVSYNNKNIEALTVVPYKPNGMNLSDSVLVVPNFSGGIGPLEGLDSVRLRMTLTWLNEDNSYYYIVVESADENAEEIETGFRIDAPRFISAPSQTSEYQVMFNTVNRLGQHRIILYHVNEEYADLYESREQDSRNLNEPLSNISNGLGVFTAFASDTLFFNVAKE